MKKFLFILIIPILLIGCERHGESTISDCKETVKANWWDKLTKEFVCRRPMYSDGDLCVYREIRGNSNDCVRGFYYTNKDN